MCSAFKEPKNVAKLRAAVKGAGNDGFELQKRTVAVQEKIQLNVLKAYGFNDAEKSKYSVH